MNLTIYDLDFLKKQCDNLSQLISEIKKAYNPENMERKLFVSRRDYEESLKQKNLIPQDFYYIRLFDCFVQITYNKQTEFYNLYLEGFYSHVLDKKERIKDTNSFIISKDFEETFSYFYDVVVDLFSMKVRQNGLF